jgi:hypothetical protein
MVEPARASTRRPVPDVVEPGTRLVERYRLEEHLGGVEHAAVDRDGTTYWRAHDELLDRPVGVCLLRAGDPNAERVLRAARRAAALTDSRFLRVLDASEFDGVVYVVSEWVRATSLVDLLDDGPLPPHEARTFSAEIAAALAAAHDAGLSHLCLLPEHVLRTAHGQVKLAGLAVDAAVRGVPPAEPAEAARRDTEAAAAVLYATLTARWPGEGSSALPPAPYDGPALCSPRQVRAGVPDDLDDVVCRALGVPGRHGGGPLRTPDELVSALAAAHLTRHIPVVPVAAPADRRSPSYPPPLVSPYDDEGAGGIRSRAATVAWAVAGLVLVVGLALFGGQLAVTGLGGGDQETPAGEEGPSAEETPPVATSRLEVVDAASFDPPPGDGDENGDRAGLAVDGDPATAWTTKTYFDPFGPAGLKDGVGLLLDLGKATDVSAVSVALQGGATDLEVRVADRAGSTVDDFELVDAVRGADGRPVLRPDEPVSARYVLVWLTSLPTVDGSNYRGEIAEVVLRG